MRENTQDDLQYALRRLDGRGYKAYRDLSRFYQLGHYQLEIAHVQGDPYAPPSRIHLRVSLENLGLVSELDQSPERTLALEDFLGRCLDHEIYSSGFSDIQIDRYGQEILSRSAISVRTHKLEIRLFVHLPARGRRIDARSADRIFLNDLPILLKNALEAPSIDREALKSFQNTAEDYAALQDLLKKNNWVAFVANGSLLPRRAGFDDRPLKESADSPVISFVSPPEFERAITLPHAGPLRGLAIEPGVTLLTGGGFHGKSTLLEAVSRGIYPHIPGDGRDLIAANPRTVKVRAEDGRSVTGTDISPFISDLPFGRSTSSFCTANASGSTSQAANIIESIEAGAEVLLLDEDTSATNFMIRDEPMRRLLRPGQEPITPFLDRVGNLFRDRGVSTVLVVGGSGEYFRVADRVIQMNCYKPADVTSLAREIIAGQSDQADQIVLDEPFPDPGAIRRLRLNQYRRKIGPRGPKIRTVSTTRILAMKEEINLGACEQLVSSSQTRTMSEILRFLLASRDGEFILSQPGGELPLDLPGNSSAGGAAARGFSPADLRRVLGGLGREMLDTVSQFPRGDLAEVRDIEVMAMLNRLRQVQVERE